MDLLTCRRAKFQGSSGGEEDGGGGGSNKGVLIPAEGVSFPLQREQLPSVRPVVPPASAAVTIFYVTWTGR
ncbi:hypothetical protein EGR_05346 [Echinococcus granulosus]|uniref:Uncharacterized protein n=1 Tax=Echinococcus granulosus TaxID=6210 RepID=W6UEJ7_ECHGR|nr:hypothetical protein EGR_05346 [Echinococcus granulosus]EUB59870.1 hypothetical protein EGR_05346 [Echinococcus granulosus]